MPQLIRVTTNRTDGVFDVSTQEDIQLPRKAKVALQSLSCTPKRDTLEITGQNDDVIFQLTQSGGERRCSLDAGVYNSGSAAALLTNISRRMSSVLDTTVSSDIGCQWRVSTNTAKGTTIERRQAPLIDFADGSRGSTKNIRRLSSGVYRRDGGVTGAFDAFIGGTTPWCQGAAVFRSRINALPAASPTASIIVGLSTKDPAKVSSAFVLGDILIGVEFTDQGTPYGVVQAGAVTPTAVNPTYVGSGNSANDTIELTRGAPDGYEEIILQVYQGGNPVAIGATMESFDTALYPVVLFVGDDTSSVRAVRSVSDPFLTSAALMALEDVHDADAFNAVPPQYNRPTTFNRLVFESSQLAAYLGFASLEYGPLTSSGTTMTFASDRQAKDFLPLESILVESVTLGVKSYNAAFDPTQSSRRSILSVLTIDKPSQTTGDPLTFVSPYPNFLSLRNVHPQVVRRLQFRLLRSDFTALELDAEGVLTILVSDVDD